MPKTVQIRDVPDETYNILRARAAARGLGVPEYLRQELTALAERRDRADVLRRHRQLVESSGPGPTREQILAAIDEGRGG